MHSNDETGYTDAMKQDAPSSALPYRPCVGIALFNEDGRIFVGERIDTPGAWQMPQGGIDEGEEIIDAAYRELAEEIGTHKAELLEVMDQAVRYDLPSELVGKLWDGCYCGQKQYWVAMRFTGREEDIDLTAHEPAEFQAWKWADTNEVFDMIVPFKRDVYHSVLRAFQKFAGASL